MLPFQKSFDTFRYADVTEPLRMSFDINVIR